MERLIIRYEDLTADPLGTMAPVIQFFAPDAAVDPDRLAHAIATAQAQKVTKIDEQWIENAGVQSRRRIEDFRFYDLDLFCGIEAIAERSRRTAATASSSERERRRHQWIFQRSIQLENTLICAPAALAVPVGKSRASAFRKIEGSFPESDAS